jgi:hypothetical protein
MSVRAATVAMSLVLLASCSNGHRANTNGGSSTTATTKVPEVNDPTLQATQVQGSDLGACFAPNLSENNTVTTFCVGEDAVQGLAASGRAYTAYSRTPSGAGVLELTFRFHPGDGARFVSQADVIFSACSGVPNIQGQAFTYEPTTAAVDATLNGTDHHTSRYGVSVGNGTLIEETGIFHKGDIGVLVAVVTNGGTRAETDALAVTAFTAAVRRAPSR